MVLLVDRVRHSWPALKRKGSAAVNFNFMRTHIRRLPSVNSFCGCFRLICFFSPPLFFPSKESNRVCCLCCASVASSNRAVNRALLQRSLSENTSCPAVTSFFKKWSNKSAIIVMMQLISSEITILDDSDEKARGKILCLNCFQLTKTHVYRT